jgi:hypothetical protein
MHPNDKLLTDATLGPALKPCPFCARPREQRDALVAALRVVLDQVDYTRGACVVTEMVGACLREKVIKLAHAAIENATK